MDATINRQRFTVAAFVLFSGLFSGLFSERLVGLEFDTQAVAQSSLRTRNFIINAPTPQLAQAVGKAAEEFRLQLADYWLGYELSPWDSPCPIKVVAGPRMAAQGVTHYDIQPVRNFRMEVIGTPERILDSVLPHEITHTILATHFGRPLPRWADEGVCTIVEHDAEKSKHEAHLRNFLRTQRGIAMNKLFLLREYPADIHPMYAQGYSVCRFLIEQQGPRNFIQFLEAYMEQPSWTDAVREFYGYESLAELQQYWLKWVADDNGPAERYAKVRPQDTAPDNVRLASAENGGLTTSPTIPASAMTYGNRNLAAGPTRPVDGPATQAAAEGDSWYLRKRDAAMGTATSVDTVPAAPRGTPAKRQPHVVAQPQPEQRMAPQPIWPTAGASTKWR